MCIRDRFRRLQRFSLADCVDVLDGWEANNSEPWKAYDRENVPAVIASVIAKKHSEQARREQAEQSAREINAVRHERGSFDMTRSFDSGMLEAYKKLKPLWDQVCNDELDSGEYELRKREILDNMGAVEHADRGEQGDDCEAVVSGDSGGEWEQAWRDGI